MSSFPFLRRSAFFAVLALACGFGSVPAFAQAPAGRPAGLMFFAGAGLTGGGSEVVVVNYSNGDSNTMRGGGVLYLYGGVQYALSDRASASLSLGYHVDSISARNGHVTFSRVPVELLAHYFVTDRVRIGGGARFSTNVHISGSGFGSGIAGSYDNSTGAVIEGEYIFTPRFGLKLRAVSEKFHESNGPGTIKGDHLGVLASFYF